MKAHPLAEDMPALAEHEDAALDESFATMGFDKRFPIIVWLDPEIGEDRIIDGLNRQAKAKKHGIDRIPWTRFEGTRADVINFIKFVQLGRRSPNPSQRAAIVAKYRRELSLGIEAAAKVAGCSISQMEKASAIAIKDKKVLERVVRGEASVHAAAKSLERTKPEYAPAEADPYHEIERTRDGLTALEGDLAEIGKQLEILCARRGGEQLAKTLRSRQRFVNGKQVVGFALVDEMIQTIKRNKPKEKCPTCKGAGCQECGDRRYVTAHEKAAMKNGATK